MKDEKNFSLELDALEEVTGGVELTDAQYADFLEMEAGYKKFKEHKASDKQHGKHHGRNFHGHRGLNGPGRTGAGPKIGSATPNVAETNT